MAKGLPEASGPIEPFSASWDVGGGETTQFYFDDHGLMQVTYEWVQGLARYFGWTEIND